MVDFDNIYNSYKENIEESFTSTVINKAKSANIEDKRRIVTNIQFEDPEVERICHEHGVYTIADARKVTSIENWFYNKNIKTFKEFKYFIGLNFIEERSFYSCEDLRSITIPASVTSIKKNSFRDCIFLEHINIPDNVTEIDEYAFASCNSLESVSMSDNVNSIKKYAFSYCYSLKSINISNNVKQLESFIFTGCSSIQAITIPDSVIAIGDEVFYYCSSLKSINIPDKVYYIGEGAFSYCENLESLNIPDSVKGVGCRAFSCNQSLKTIYISKKCPAYSQIEGEYPKIKLVDPSLKESFTTGVINKTKSMTQEEKRADVTQIQFEDPEVERICHEHGVYTYRDAAEVTSIKGWFINNSKITSFDEFKYFTGLTNIEVSAFSRCDSLKSIMIPNSVTSIGEFAFLCCKSFTSINIPNSVTSIEEAAFQTCTSLTSINIPDSVTSIRGFTFKNCTSLPSIIIHNGVTSIGMHAFWECKSLKSVNIPDSVTNIGKEAFAYCKSLQSINIPDSVTIIKKFVFDECKSLKSIIISKNCSVYDEIKSEYPDIQLVEQKVYESFTSNVIDKAKSKTQEEKRADIAQIPFEDPEVERICHEHGVYTIRDARKVSSIEGWFSKNEKIHSFVESEYFTGLKDIGYYVFYSCEYLQFVNIPNSVTHIGDNAFTWCESLLSINIPDDVTSIGNYSFYNCSSLQSVNIPNSVTSIGYCSFGRCFSLQSINIPNSVTSIGIRAFGECDSLQSIYISKNCPVYDQIKEEYPNIQLVDPSEMNESFTKDVINKAKSATIEDKRENILHIQFEDLEVERICHEHGVYTYDDAKEVASFERWFTRNNSIKTFNEMRFFTGLKEIGEYAFYGCYLLKSVIIPDSVKTICCNAFSDCESLHEIIIPDSVTSIEKYAFYRCESLESINIPSNITFIGSTAFGSCCSIKKVTIPKHINCIEPQIFMSCKGLEEVYIQDGVKSIGNGAFSLCRSLKTISIPSSVKTIGTYLFYECADLKTIYISKSCPVYSDIEKAYPKIQLVDPSEMNESFTSNVIKKTKETSSEDKREKVVNIQFEDPEIERICHENGIYTYDDAKNCDEDSLNWLFEYNQNIVSFDEFKYFTNVKYLITGLFEGCRSLESIILPSSLISINYKSFQDCTKLKNIIIPEGIKNIRPFAFRDCWSLTHVEIPSTVKLIDDRAFANCVNLKSIVIPDALEAFGDLVFKNSIKTMYVSKKCKIYYQLYRYCEDYRIDLIDKDTNEKELEFLRESFTSNVIKKTKETTQEEKRKELFDYVDLGLPSGNLWCKHNYGAKEEYEDGEYHDYEETMNLKLNSFEEIPSNEDFKELIKFCKHKWTKINGINGIEFTSSFNKQKIFLPASGLYNNTIKYCYMEDGHYWSSSKDYYNSISMYFTKSHISTNNLSHRNYIFSVRTVKKNDTDIKESFTSTVINKAKSTTIEEQRNEMFKIEFEDPAVEKICHLHGIYTIGDAKKVKSIMCRNSERELYGWFKNNLDIKKFNEFKYFTGLEKIEFKAFYKCGFLTEITLPDSIKSIENYAFESCSNLRKINIPDSVEKIEERPFEHSGIIQYPGGKVIISKDNPLIEELKSVPHYRYMKFIDPSEVNESFTSNVIKKAKETTQEQKRQDVVQIQFEDPVVEKVCHEHGVYTIADAANVKSLKNGDDSLGWFFYNEKITKFNELKLFTSLEVISNSSFYHCKNLKEITLPENVKVLEEGSFTYCRNLTKININDKLEKISIGAFAECDSLKSIYLPTSIKIIGHNNLNNIEEIYVPSHCDFNDPQYKEFADLIIRSSDPSKIKNIIRINRDEYDEMMNESFTSNVINKVKSASIEDKRENVLHIPFEDSEVERICHEHGVYTINDAAKVTSIFKWFTENEKIRRFEEFKYFTGLTSIDQLAFDACYFLYRITLPENINRIETSAFRDCISLKYIQLPDKVEIIEDQAFKSDEELQYIGIGPNVKSIGSRCFAFCKNLKYIVLPDSLRQIGTTVFQRCNKLSQINIPDNALILEPQKLFDYRGKGFDSDKEHIDIIISKNHPNYRDLEFIYNSKESTFIDPSEVNESFTSKVLDKAKSTSIDDKRKELFDYVDLGLPSGTLWCKHNYGVKEEYEYGERYSHNDAMALETDTDRLPLKENFIELDENCTHKFTSINGINGELFTSKINGQTIFFPAGGQEETGHLYNLGRSGHYWSSSKQNIGAYTLHFLAERVNPHRYRVSRRSIKKLSVRLVRYDKVNESFTSNVIKKTKEITQDDKRQIVSNINFEDPEIEHICHSNGVYTYADAANVKDGDNILSCFVNNEHIKKFNEFKYFTSLKYVPGYFFDGSPNIEEITLPESINVIEKGAFYGCNLKKIRIPNNVVSIRSNAFAYCDKLEDVEFDVDNSKLLLLEGGVFINCISIKSLHLPNNLQSIGKHSFAEMIEMTELYIPNSLNHIIDARTLFFYFGCVRNNQKTINLHISKKCLAYNELYDSFKDCPGVNFIIEDEVNESFTSNVIKNTKEITIEDKRSIVSKYIDLGLPSGNLWYTCNVGANNEEEVGDRLSYKEALFTNDTKIIPDDQDFQELISNTNHNVEKVNGVIGMRLTSQINGRSIFFPATGTLHETGELYDDDFFGGYRSSTEITQGLSHCMMFNIVQNTIIAAGQEWGSNKFPVRLVQKNNLKESFTTDVIKKHKNEDNIKKEEIKEELLPEIKEFIYYNIAHELKKYDIEIKDLKYTNKEIGVVFNIIYKEKLSDVDKEFFGELSNSDIHVTIIPVQTGTIEQQCDLYVRDKSAYYLAGKIFIGSYREILNGIVEELKTLVDNIIKNKNLKESFTSKVIKDTKEKTQEDKRKDLFNDIVFDAQKLVNILLDHSYTYSVYTYHLTDPHKKVFRIFVKMDDQDGDILLNDPKDITSYVGKNVKVIYIQYSSKENRNQTFAKISLDHFNKIFIDREDVLPDIMKNKIAFTSDDRNFYTFMRVFDENVVTQFGKILKD